MPSSSSTVRTGGAAHTEQPNQPPDSLLDHFDALHGRDADPWRVTSRWYEIRKRNLLLSVLPQQRYRRVLDVGCSTGVGTRLLAERADELVAMDFSAAAVDHARRRLAGLDHVRLQVSNAVDGLPPGPFDLVVLSEVGYYLTEAELDQLLDRIAAASAPYAELVVCHWRHHEGDFRQDGDEVHRRVLADPRWSVTVDHTERDFLLQVLCATGAEPTVTGDVR